MVLTKNGKSTRKVKGKFAVIIRGENSSGSAELRLMDIKKENNGKVDSFSFRYFQVFEGEMVLPETFTPYEVEINIIPSTKKVESVTETISWTRVVSEDP